MKRITNLTRALLFLCLVVATSFDGSGQLIAQDPLKPGLNYEQRIELARKLLEAVRQKATTDLSSRERMYYFTKHWAEIDPAWTARFILENPVQEKQGSKGVGRALYDNDAIRVLMSRPTEIDETLLVDLLELGRDSYLFEHYSITAIENLPKEQTELQERIIRVATADRKTNQISPFNFDSKLKLAGFSSDPEVLQRVKQRIEEFYLSGNAKKAWDAMKKQAARNRAISGGRLDMARRRFRRHAPEPLRDEFGLEPESPSAQDIYSLLRDDSLDGQEKAVKINKMEKFEFGKLPHEQMMAAAALGSVAVFDHELALKWAETAPALQPRIWARLTIAPALAKHAPDAAKKLISECYADLSEIDPSDQNSFNASFSPASIGAHGLRLVDCVDASLLEACIDKTIFAINPLRTSQMNSAENHIFQTIAAIAPYDRAKAEKLFDEFSDDVRVGSAAGKRPLAPLTDLVLTARWEFTSLGR